MSDATPAPASDAAASLGSGILLDELDPDIRPGDDLYRHVNARWMDRTEIPEDKARYGAFHKLDEEAQEAVRVIIDEATHAEPGSEERRFGDLYTSFMDTERIESLGLAPLTAQLAELDGIDGVESLLTAVGRLERNGFGGFYAVFVDNDPGDPSRYLVFIEQSGLGLPDESYYREDSFLSVREAYLTHLARMFGIAGLDEPEARARRVFDLETAIASAHWDKVTNRDSRKTYNPTPWAGVLDAFPGLATWAAAVDAPAGSLDTVVLRQPSFSAALAGLVTEERLDAWRDWARWQVIRGSAAYLNDEIARANFDFYGTTLTGAPEMRPRWKRGVSFVEGAMGEAVGRIYVERHYPPAAEAAMQDLLRHLVEAYRGSISTLDWMGEETRGRALEKLDKFTPKVGYPVKWRDYSALEVVADDLLANVRAAKEFEFQRELAKIGAPIDRDEWFMTPQTINAYYNPGFNEIVFPAAILQFPFFDAGRDAAANYGAIGAVIGHEIGHGFDDQGSRFDGDGRLVDWWTEEDRSAFEQRTGSLIAQYDALAPAQTPLHRVNGSLTIGENIGDLGGLAIAWKAYLLSLDGAEPVEIDGLTGAQRFFLSWAQAWQQKARDEEVVRLLAIDPHSPPEFRCNQIARNIDAFYDAFGVGPDDAMWLAPDQRVSIW